MYKKLPEELKQRGRFCLWKYEMRKGQQTKVPYRTSGEKADPGDSNTFTDFKSAQTAYLQGGYNGIGLGIFDDVCAVDIDHCIKDGALSDMAGDIIRTLDSYTETSPSGTGVRIIFTAPGLSYSKDEYYINNHKIGLEIYNAGKTKKYVTVTVTYPVFAVQQASQNSRFRQSAHHKYLPQRFYLCQDR